MGCYGVRKQKEGDSAPPLRMTLMQPINWRMYKVDTQGDMKIDWSKIGRLSRALCGVQVPTCFAEGRDVMQ